MKKKKTILISVLISLLGSYVILYYIGVKPYDPEADEVYMQLSRGWDPVYTYKKNYSATSSHQIFPCKWNNFARRFFTPIHQIDRIARSDLWLDAEEKHEITLRASLPIEAPLQIHGAGHFMDGGSISIQVLDKNSTGFKVILRRTIRMRREGIPQYITINDRKLESGGPEEQQLAIDLNDWLENSSDEASEHEVSNVKEIVDEISNRT